jgi:hypothetical protein
LEYLGYLSENLQANICLQSENFATTWLNIQSTETVNAVASPDGAITADKLVEDAIAGATHAIYQPIVAIANTVYATSFFVKIGERSKGKLWWTTNGFVSGCSVLFDLVAETVSGLVAHGTGTATSASITKFQNGWYRIELVGNLNVASIDGNIVIQLRDAAGATTYNGDGVSGFYVWGAQVEAGIKASSYIPTVAASVSRNLDSLTYPTAGWFNASAGTFFAEFRAFTPTFGDNVVVSAHDGTIGERLIAAYNAQPIGNATFAVMDGAVLQVAISGGVTIANTRTKLVSAYALNDFAVSKDGGAVATDVAGTLPTVTTLSVGLDVPGGGIPLNGVIRNVAYWPIRRPNSQLSVLSA